MSILLDALKKSEAQRQLGQAPDIYSEQGSEPSTGGKRTNWLLWTLVVFVIAAAAWMGWRQLDRVGAPGGSGADARQVAMPDAAAEQTAGDSQQQPLATTQMTADEQDVRGQRTPVESFSADEPPARDGAAQPETDSSVMTRQAQVSESFSRFEPAEEASENEAQAESNVRPAEPAAAPVAKDKASRAARAEPKSPGTEPISFWELPQDVRDSLPDLHITVLVYAEESAERFVLIGGKRVVEKEQVEQGVVLEEIRREGAVFRYRNYRFLVKS